MTKITIRRILKSIACDKLELRRVDDGGYFLFSYDDPERNIYEEQSVYAFRLNRLKFETWVDIGKTLVSQTESKES